jgi:hypothetical protein
LALLVRVSTHTPLQRTSPEGQAHVPFMHVVPLTQAFPHAPQLVLLDLRSTHALLHAVSPVPQLVAQTPLLHKGVAPPQRVPQAPQFWGSALTSAHVPAQSRVPAGQTHLPPLQSCEALHAFVHEPQCRSSVAVSTQALEQLVSPDSQLDAQTPRLQTCPVHALPQPPQWLGSLAGSTHRSLQRMSRSPHPKPGGRGVAPSPRSPSGEASPTPRTFTSEDPPQLGPANPTTAAVTKAIVLRRMASPSRNMLGSSGRRKGAPLA